MSGVLRRSRNAFIHQILQAVQPGHILEIGGGIGGDVVLWALAKDVRLVDVVEPDATAVAEYMQRIGERFNGRSRPGPGTPVLLSNRSIPMELPDGRRFVFHVVPGTRFVKPSRIHPCSICRRTLHAPDVNWP